MYCAVLYPNRYSTYPQFAPARAGMFDNLDETPHVVAAIDCWHRQSENRQSSIFLPFSPRLLFFPSLVPLKAHFALSEQEV